MEGGTRESEEKREKDREERRQSGRVDDEQKEMKKAVYLLTS